MKCKHCLNKLLLIGIFIFFKYVIASGSSLFIPQPNHADTSCLFINTAPANITDYVWNFGDGEIIHDTSKISHTHKYASPGQYSVCLIIADSSEVTPTIDTTCQLIEILDVNSECFADFSFKFINDYKIKFTDNSTGDYKKVLWYFGDGEYSTIKNSITYTYKEPGYYDVKLAILDDSSKFQSQTTKCVVVAEEDIIIDAYFTDSINSFDKNTIYFINHSPKSNKYLWELDDGTITDEENPVHYYQTPGIYNVNLTVYDTITGKMDTYDKSVKVNISAFEIKSNFEYFPDIGNKKVYFLDKSIGDQIENYLWDYGDGNTSAIQSPVHQYAQKGIYDVCLSTWGNDESYYNTHCKKVDLIDSIDNFTDFYFYADSVGKVNFKNVSRGDNLIYSWDFGDSTFSDETNPVHTYRDTGIYVIHLIADDGYDKLHQFKILNFRSEKKSLISGIGLIEEDLLLKSAGTKKIRPKGLISGDISKFAWKFNNTIFNNTSLSPLALDISDPYNEICLELYNYWKDLHCKICKEIQLNLLNSTSYKNENRILNIFPNPANDYISVEYLLEDFENAYFEIIELSGRKVKNIPIRYGNVGRNILKISFNNLKSGNYYLRFITENKVEIINVSVIK